MSIGLLCEPRSSDVRPYPVAYAALHEAEDVLVRTASIERLPVVRPDYTPSFRLRRLVRRASLATGLGATRLPQFPLLDPTVEGHWDLVVAILRTPAALVNVEALRSLHRRAGKVAVWIPEMWPIGIDMSGEMHEAYDLVDVIATACADSAAALSAALDRPVHHLPLAVDAGSFAPAVSESTPSRSSGVINIGRRDPALHDALLSWSDRSGHFYLYDTIVAPTIVDAAAHRRLLAAQFQRSSVAICSYAKFDEPEVIGDTRELPGRLFEGLAAGCRLLGQPPAPELQRSVLGQIVVEPLAADPAAAVDQIGLAVADSSDRRSYSAVALRGHDWAHRWATLFELAEHPIPEGLTSRIDSLARRAELYDR